MARGKGSSIGRALLPLLIAFQQVGCEADGGGTLTVMGLVDGAPAEICFSLEWAATRTVGCTDPGTGEWTGSFRGDRAGLLVVEGGDPESGIAYQASGDDVLLATFPQGVRRAVAVRGGDRELVEITGQSLAGGRVTGRVVVDGEPFFPAEVVLFGREAHRVATDPEGRYEFSKLRPGSHQLRIAGADTIPVAFRDLERTVVVEDGGEQEEVILGYRLGDATLTGQVTALDGTPVSSMLLRLRGIFGGDLSTRTGFNGAFTFTRLPPGEFFLLGDDVTIQGRVAWSLVDQGEGMPVQIAAGQTDVSQDLVATRMDTRIQGMVGNDRDRDGLLRGDEVPPTVVRVIQGSDPDGAIVAEIEVPSNGSFTTPLLPEGTYTLIAVPGTSDVPARFATPSSGQLHRDVTTRAGWPVVGRGGRSPPMWSYAVSGPVPPSMGPADFVAVYVDGSVSGRVTADGAPVVGVEVSVVRCALLGGLSAPLPLPGEGCEQRSDERYAVTTGADGRFRISGLEEGRWEIFPPSAQGLGNVTPSRYAFELAGPGAAVPSMNFEVEPWGPSRTEARP